METHKTVFVNTLSQYIKAITTTCLSLYTVRLVLSALGQSDYGIYSRCWHHCHAGIYYQCYGNNHTTPSVFFARSTRYQCTMQVFFQQPANSSGSRLVVSVASFLVPRLSLYIILQHPRHTPKCSCRCILVDVRDTLFTFCQHRLRQH